MVCVLAQIESLKEDEYDDDFLAPTKHAIDEATKLLTGVDSSSLHGHVSTSGSGEIRIEWIRDSAEIRLVVPASETEMPYIYHDNGLSYGIDKNVSVESLARCLKDLEG